MTISASDTNPQLSENRSGAILVFVLKHPRSPWYSFQSSSSPIILVPNDPPNDPRSQSLLVPIILVPHSLVPRRRARIRIKKTNHSITAETKPPLYFAEEFVTESDESTGQIFVTEYAVPQPKSREEIAVVFRGVSSSDTSHYSDQIWCLKERRTPNILHCFSTCMVCSLAPSSDELFHYSGRNQNYSMIAN